MVLILQLDDDGLPVEHEASTRPINQTADHAVANGVIHDSRAGKRDHSPPPPYSALPSGPYSHRSIANLRLDQPWSFRAAEVPPGTDSTSDFDFQRVTISAERDDRAGSIVESEGVDTVVVEQATAAPSRMEQPVAILFGRLLRAYPVVISLVSHLDLTDLSSLSLSSRAVQSGLSYFRKQVIAHSLRCVNETTPRDPTTAAPPRWFPPCARDLVAPCCRCSQAVCRNCTAKPVSGSRSMMRHRRLCQTCQSSPMSLLGADVDGSWGLHCGICTCASIGVHICRTCDSGQNGADQNYSRVWSWRSRYRNLGFGLGTGLGEGNEGVKCGRGASCLAALDLIVDMDCAEALKSAHGRGRGPTSLAVGDIAGSYLLGGVGSRERRDEDTPPTPSTPLNAIIVDNGILDAAGAGIGAATSPGLGASFTPVLEASRSDSSMSGMVEGSDRGETNESAGYYRQEVEGIGGVVKKKLKKRVRVGAPVREYEDESQKGAFLERERTGATRSWCAWCDCVIPSAADVEMMRR